MSLSQFAGHPNSFPLQCCTSCHPSSRGANRRAEYKTRCQQLFPHGVDVRHHVYYYCHLLFPLPFPSVWMLFHWGIISILIQFTKRLRSAKVPVHLVSARLPWSSSSLRENAALLALVWMNNLLLFVLPRVGIYVFCRFRRYITLDCLTATAWVRVNVWQVVGCY